MQDPINMYKRERHDTSSSVNANLYVSKVEDRTMHYRCTTVDWKGNKDKYSIDWLQLIRGKDVSFRNEKEEKINGAKLDAFDRIRGQIVSDFVCNAIYAWLNW